MCVKHKGEVALTAGEILAYSEYVAACYFPGGWSPLLDVETEFASDLETFFTFQKWA